MNDLENIYAARHTFNPEYLLNVVTAHVPINRIAELSSNYNVIKIGDGELELVPEEIESALTLSSINLNNENQVSPLNVMTYHSIPRNIMAGNGITIGVLDTNNEIAHDALNETDIIKRGHCQLADKTGVCPEHTNATRINPHVIRNSNAHFNPIAGMIIGTGVNNLNVTPNKLMGISPAADLILATGDTAESLVHALNYLVGQDVDLISASTGPTISICHLDYTMKHSQALVAESIVQNGIPIIKSSGNRSSVELSVMACSSNAIVVGNMRITRQIDPSSSRADTITRSIKPDIVTIGNNLVLPDIGRDYAIFGGTSYSTPIVAAATAHLLGKDSTLTPNEIRAALLLGANFNHDNTVTSSVATASHYEQRTGDVWAYMDPFGFGSLNVEKSMLLVNDNPAPNIISAPAPSNFDEYTIRADKDSRIKVLLTWNLATVGKPPLLPVDPTNPYRSIQDYTLRVTAPNGSEMVSNSSFQTKEFAFFTASESGTYTIRVESDPTSLGHVGYTLGSTHPLTAVPPTGTEIPPDNRPPEITVTTSAREANPGDVVTLTAVTSDPDINDSVTVSWQVTREDIDITLNLANNDRTATFTVPENNTGSIAYYVILATATDNHGATDADLISIQGTVPSPWSWLDEFLDALSNLGNWNNTGAQSWTIGTPLVLLPQQAGGTSGPNTVMIAHSCGSNTGLGCIAELRPTLDTSDPLSIKFDRFVHSALSNTRGV